MPFKPCKRGKKHRLCKDGKTAKGKARDGGGGSKSKVRRQQRAIYASGYGK